MTRETNGDGRRREVLDALSGIRFGSVEVIIHDSQIVQVIRTEKIKLDASPREPLRHR